MDRSYRKRTAAAESPPSEAWLFAQALLGNPVPHAGSTRAEAQAQREYLQWLAEISTDHEHQLQSQLQADAAARAEREQLEWLATISTEHERKLRTVLSKEAEEREAWRRAQQFSERLLEGDWDPSKHPRGAYAQNRGWWSPGSGAGSAAAAPVRAGGFQTADSHTGQTAAQLAAVGGAQSPAWPGTGPASSWLPKVGSGAAAGAGAAAGVGAGGLLGGLRNASMGAYWSRVPGTQALPSIWAYELEKRVRAGTLSREDAIGIFSTAVLGAEAQGFKPTGGTMSAVHKSAVDFLGKAEAIYFARKKKDAEVEGAEAKPVRVTGEALAKARREFEGMKPSLWKEEAGKNPDKYTPEQLDRMRRGEAPKTSDGKSMEIHHKLPLSEGGHNTYDNFEFMPAAGHRLGPNFKKNHPNLPRGRAK